MRQRLATVLLLMSGIMLLTGCGSIMGRTTMQEGHTYYSGVRNDMARVSGSGDHDYDFLSRSRAFIDLPLSAVADTLYAPVDYFHGPYSGRAKAE